MKKIFAITILLLILGLGFNVKAQTPDPEGITLSPVVTELTLDPGESQEVILKIRNNESVAVVSEISYGELTEKSDDPSDYEILPVEYQAEPILKPKFESFKVNAKETYELPVQITMPKTPTKGSYYPVILVGLKTEGQESFSTLGEIASIFYLNLNSDKDSEGNIYNIDVNPYLKIELDAKYRIVPFPLNEFNVKVENVGRTYVKPYGNLTVIDATNTKLKDIPINQRLKILLPGQKLEADYPWNEFEGKSFWYYLIPRFGKYTVAFGVDDQNRVSSISETFWVIPFFHLLALLILIIFIVYKWNKVRSKRRANPST